ncbi:MAG: Hsp70 family protein [Planctomycetes bacterium]|nr:Hsp70 family protein [Planctomycetota bacterium]
MEKKHIVGIDLGTTYSAIAHFDEHSKPEIVPNIDNERITPSVIYFGEDEIIVGRVAKNESVADPENVVQFVKRYMGDPDRFFPIRGTDYTPETLSAIIMLKLVGDADKVLNFEPGTITDAVITVPAYFNDTERKATQDAGKIAGLNVIATLNEPTAAALAYGMDQDGEPKTVLVYDLGGGTFDVTIINIHGKNIEVLATDGERKLGGKDFDDELINYVSENFIDEFGIDPRDDLDSLQDLQIKCEEAKITLSRKDSVRILVQCQGNSMKVEVTRKQFEELIRPLIEQTETYLGLVLNEADITWDNIDEVLCVGGSTRIPMVRDMLEKVTGKAPNIEINPDEVVSLGAAYYAGLLTVKEAQEKGEEIPEETISPEVVGLLEGLVVENVNSHSLGIVTIINNERQNVIMIPAQTKLPARTEKLFQTAYDNQVSVEVQVVEGSSVDVDECTMIGTLRVSDLPTNRLKGSLIRVSYEYDMNGRVNIYARDEETGKDASTEILRETGMTEDEVMDQHGSLQELVID